MNAALNMINNNQMPASVMMGMNASQAVPFPAMLPRMGPGSNENSQGNVSLEMLQSFIQRNANNGGNVNPQT